MRAAIYSSTLIWLLGMSSWIPAQEIQNGGFETNLVTNCGINLSNGLFNSKVPFITAFGSKNELDLLSDACGYGLAPEGRFFVAANFQNVSTDAFSFELTALLQKDLPYFIRFAAKVAADTFDLNTRIVLGLSNQPDSFGVRQAQSNPLTTQWTYIELRVTPTDNSSYLTLKLEGMKNAWVFLDDFSIVCPQVDLGNDTTYCVVHQIPVSVKDVFDSYIWSTGDVGATITVDQPGTYWLEAQAGACVARDTVVILEFEHRCDCQVFLPNAFTPNLDGNNEAFAPVSRCAFTDYVLTIYNQWGNLVFVANRPEQVWTGTGLQGEYMPEGVYAYRLRYRFFYDTQSEWTSGTLTLYR